MSVFRGCAVAVALVLAAAFGVLVVLIEDEGASASGATDSSAKGQQGLKGVPVEFRRWILKADKECKHPEMSPALLAAQLSQESGFRVERSTVSPKGAQGPAQFMPGTWATWGRDVDGDGVADPFDIGDAVMAQGRFMCSLIGEAKSSGITGDPRRLALAGYNAGWYAVKKARGIPRYRETQDYVRIIMSTMTKFEGSPGLEVIGTGTGPDALRRASALIGTPYSWGGGSPSGPTTGFCDGTNGYDKKTGKCAAATTSGFDCSSLVQYSFWPDLQLPRTAQEQYGATADRPVAKKNLEPGDLLFWSNRSGFIYHVAIYAGDGKVVHAPRTGRKVELRAVSSAMPAADYHGATRP